jgi:hypothetical protein
MTTWDGFDASLGQMRDGIRRAHEALLVAHQAFQDADEGFLHVLEGLTALTTARGSFEDRFTDMQETIARLETLVLGQSDELRALRERLDETKRGE